ncbi:MAG: hypothetical protein ACJ76Q_12595, partial [Solirubrobacteraceae bacterium]
MGTESRGASNAKAKRELGWTLRHPSWRHGSRAAYGHEGSAAMELTGLEPAGGARSRGSSAT